MKSQSVPEGWGEFVEGNCIVNTNMIHLYDVGPDHAGGSTSEYECSWMPYRHYGQSICWCHI